MLLPEVNKTSLVRAFSFFSADHVIFSLYSSSVHALCTEYGIMGDDSCDDQLSAMNHNTASSDCNVNKCTDHV